MPIFFLDLREHSGIVVDLEGCAAADEAGARVVAIHSARDVMAGDILAGVLRLDSFIDIYDADHCLLEAMPFRSAVTVAG